MREPCLLTHNDRRFRREKVVAAFQRIGDPRQVAEQFGVSKSLVHRALREAGMGLRMHGGRNAQG